MEPKDLIVWIGGIAMIAYLVFTLWAESKKKHKAKSAERARRADAETRENDIPGTYTIIADAGYANEIVYTAYEKLARKEYPQVAVEQLLQEKNMLITMQDKGLEHVCAWLEQVIPGFSFSYEKAKDGLLPLVEMDGGKRVAQYKGVICGVSVDAKMDSEYFVPDVLNPILSKKFGKQLLFAFPGSDQCYFLLVSNDRIATLKANRFFTQGATYSDIEKWYGYRHLKAGA